MTKYATELRPLSNFMRVNLLKHFLDILTNRDENSHYYRFVSLISSFFIFLFSKFFRGKSLGNNWGNLGPKITAVKDNNKINGLKYVFGLRDHHFDFLSNVSACLI